jgi:serine/threonine-protein kinase
MPPRDEPLIALGQQVEGHEVIEHLGMRGMSDRYRVRDPLGVERILGLITAHHPDLVHRLRDLPLLRLRHPNLLGIEAVFEVGRLPALLSEPVRGRTLTAWLNRRQSVDPASALLLFRGVLEGVAAAHSIGVVHRDLRPENILVEGDVVPQARVMDLGVASALFDLVIGGRSVTSSGTTIGEPRYWSPERARRPQSADERADLFSLGCLLYELFVGAGPFDGLNLYDCYHATMDGRYASLESRSFDAPLEVLRLVPRLLAPKPEDRPATCAEVLQSLLPPNTVPPAVLPVTPVTPAPPLTPVPPVGTAQSRLSPAAVYAALAAGAAVVSALVIALGWAVLR